jgi:hypothetical protein
MVISGCEQANRGWAQGGAWLFPRDGEGCHPRKLQSREYAVFQGFFLTSSPKGRHVRVERNCDSGVTFEPDGAQGRRRSEGRVRPRQAGSVWGSVANCSRARLPLSSSMRSSPSGALRGTPTPRRYSGSSPPGSHATHLRGRWRKRFGCSAKRPPWKARLPASSGRVPPQSTPGVAMAPREHHSALAGRRLLE